MYHIRLLSFSITSYVLSANKIFLINLNYTIRYSNFWIKSLKCDIYLNNIHKLSSDITENTLHLKHTINTPCLQGTSRCLLWKSSETHEDTV